jgi:hypothetical protein
MPLTINVVIPFVQNIADSVEDEGQYFKPRLDNRRHEKEKEKLQELSRNNSSCGTERISSSRIRASQEKRVPESGDGAKRTRCTRQQLLNASLANAPTPQSSPIHTRPPPPIPPSPPPPLTRHPADISRPNTATEEIERERQRRYHQSNQNRSSGTLATCAASPWLPPPPPSPQVHTRRMAQPRLRVQSLNDATKAHGAEDSMRRRSVYSERHSASRNASERRPSMGKP